ncbi:(2Fe-2S)-binding protein [Pigmentiphaga soli]|uniref:(2Fe-2S)-binding protein n=1 Tax=Pigmentiphaga soli TaxID=1007095 RepID=A0ABP8HFI7_9BURK
MAASIGINVNGQERLVQAGPDTPLLYVLRNELGLHATKFGCGLAQCGVCSVLMDGREIRSCVTPVSVAAGHRITTVEGLGAAWAGGGAPAAGGAPPLHPVQQAWIDMQVPQCGYCQSGMMIQAVSLLNANPHPSRDDIRAGMEGHICRCGTHMRIIAAVEHAATQMSKEG